jgi:hypothetical protein
VIFVTSEDRADKLKETESLAPNPGLPTGPQVLPGGAGGLLPPGMGVNPPAAPLM